MKKNVLFILLSGCLLITACSTGPDKESIAEMRTEKKTGNEEETAYEESSSVTEKGFVR